MIIIVAGNIASGKSAFAKALAGKLNHFTVLGIDEFRNQYRNEQMAQAKLLSEFYRHKNVIYETTACNRIHREIMNAVLKQGQKNVFIRIICPIAVCKIRYEARTTYAHFGYDIKIEQSLAYIEQQLRYVSSDLLFDSTMMTTEQMVLDTLAFLAH